MRAPNRIEVTAMRRELFLALIGPALACGGVTTTTLGSANPADDAGRAFDAAANLGLFRAPLSAQDRYMLALARLLAAISARLFLNGRARLANAFTPLFGLRLLLARLVENRSRVRRSIFRHDAGAQRSQSREPRATIRSGCLWGNAGELRDRLAFAGDDNLFTALRHRDVSSARVGNERSLTS